MATVGLPGFSAGGGMAIAPSSSASAQGGSLGAFNFSPKDGIPAWALVAVAAVALLLLTKR